MTKNSTSESDEFRLLPSNLFSLFLMSLAFSFIITWILSNILLQLGYYTKELFQLTNIISWPVIGIGTGILVICLAIRKFEFIRLVKLIPLYIGEFYLFLLSFYNIYLNLVKLSILPSGLDLVVWVLSTFLSILIVIVLTDLINTFYAKNEIHTFLLGFFVTYIILAISFLFFVGRQEATNVIGNYIIVIAFILSCVLGLSLVIIHRFSKIENELKMSELRYRFFFEQAPIGIGISDFEGNVVTCNDKIAEILGYSLEELKSVNMEETFIEVKDRTSKLNELLEKGVLENIEVPRKRKDGSICYTLTNLELTEWGNRKLILNSTLDITERKKIEEKLRESEERLEFALWGAGEGLWDWDLTTNTVKHSDLWHEIFGYDHNEIDGEFKKWECLVHPDDLPQVTTIVKDFMNGKTPLYEAEHRLRSKSGDWVWISDRGKVVEKDNNDIPLRAIGTTQNITERKNIEIIREDLKKKRENFIQVTSHELRTPITSLQGAIEFLDRIRPEDFEAEKTIFFKIIRNSLYRLERLIRDLSNISRIERGVFEVEKEKINIIEFLKEEASVFESFLEEQFDFTIPNRQTPLFVEMDKERLGQVLANLVDNAVKNSSFENRKVILGVSIEGDSHIRISIKDNGAGIEQHNLERIFEQFVTIPTKYSVKGSGIGLFICKIIIENHDGKITAFSEGLDKGSEFVVTLPVMQINDGI